MVCWKTYLYPSVHDQVKKFYVIIVSKAFFFLVNKMADYHVVLNSSKICEGNSGQIFQ